MNPHFAGVKPRRGPVSVANFTRTILAIAGTYAFAAVVWFFLTFAKNMGQPVQELFPSMLFSMMFAVVPYLLFGVATFLALRQWTQTALLVLAVVSACSTIALYIGAFAQSQDGEFMILFMIVGTPQLIAALIILVLAAVVRDKSASHEDTIRGADGNSH
jgi:hypothetical protein